MDKRGLSCDQYVTIFVNYIEKFQSNCLEYKEIFPFEEHWGLYLCYLLFGTRYALWVMPYSYFPCERSRNPSVMGSGNTNVPLYPSLKKRGKGRFHQHNFKIPLYPPEAVKKSGESVEWEYLQSFRIAVFDRQR